MTLVWLIRLVLVVVVVVVIVDVALNSAVAVKLVQKVIRVLKR